MDIVFNCSDCHQELVVDASGAGSEIECPSCKTTLEVPQPDAANVRTHNPIASSAAAREEHHFIVPQHERPSETLIEKPLPPLEVAKDADRKMRIKTIRRVDCVEVGKDHFDEKVTQFLEKVGESNVQNITTISYTHFDLASRKVLSDYGVIVVYKG